MKLNDVLVQSHQSLRQLINQVQNSKDDHQKSLFFTQLWQNFLVHEQAEETVAYQIMTQSQPENLGKNNEPLDFTVSEHHYFEQFVEHILTTLDYNETVTFESRNQLYQEFMQKLEAHMQYEEEFVFAKMAEQFDSSKHKQLVGLYLDKISELNHKNLQMVS